jgi:hypothetical protein
VHVCAFFEESAEDEAVYLRSDFRDEGSGDASVEVLCDGDFLRSDCGDSDGGGRGFLCGGGCKKKGECGGE